MSNLRAGKCCNATQKHNHQYPQSYANIAFILDETDLFWTLAGSTWVHQAQALPSHDSFTAPSIVSDGHMEASWSYVPDNVGRC